jgi:alkylated DNA nucleotide flippase Atl1
MVIPAPREVDEIMQNVPEGKIITINKIREKLAKKHKTNTACPICTGIFASISAQAAEEERVEGKTKITPWWRTLKENGILNPKYPGGEKNQKKLLEEEGHKILQKGKIYRVENFEEKLVS